ncbi:hypothetical protein Tco_0019944 [Tanacetum coccineum]
MPVCWQVQNSNDLGRYQKKVISAGYSSKETGIYAKDYILMPLWKDGSLFDSSLKNASNDEPQPSSDVGKKDDEGVCKESEIADQEKFENRNEDLDSLTEFIGEKEHNKGHIELPRACIRLYPTYLLDNRFREVQKDNTLKIGIFHQSKQQVQPMVETSKPLLKDAEVEDVNVHLYRSMISSLMYLTSSRPDIIIFRYLKGQPKLGLWYPKDSPFDLEAYSDSDYAGASLEHANPSKEGSQFLGSMIDSFQCKKQTIVCQSTTKAKYVAAASCCEQPSDGKKVIAPRRYEKTLQLKDAEVTLVDEAHERIDDNLIFDTGVFDEQEVEVEKSVITAKVTIVSATTTTVNELTLAQTLIEIKATKPKAVTTAATITTTAVTRPKARGVVVQEPSEFRTTISSQLPQVKDKGKAKMIKPEKPLKKKDQILVDEEIAQKIQ